MNDLGFDSVDTSPGGVLDTSYEAPPPPDIATGDSGIASDMSGGSQTSADVFIQNSTPVPSTATVASMGTGGGGSFWPGLANILAVSAVGAGTYAGAKARSQYPTTPYPGYPGYPGVARPGAYSPLVPGALQSNMLLPLLAIGAVILLMK